MRGLRCADARVHPNAQIWSKGGFREANLPPPFQPPPHRSRLFAQFPLFPKQKGEQGAARRPQQCLGRKLRFLAFLRPWLRKGGRGQLSPGHTKPPAPARPRGWRRGGAGGRARPHIAPRPSRPRPAAHRHAECAHTRGGGDRSAHVCTRPDGCTRSCPRFHLRSRTRCAHPPLPRAHPARAPPAASPPPPPRAPAPRTPPPGPPLGHAPPERRAPLRPRPLSRSTNGRRLVPCRARPPRCLLSRSNAPAAAARHRSAAPRRSDAPGATWRAAARCAGPAGGARRGRGRKGVMQRGAGGARDEGAWKNPNAPPGWGGMGRAAPPEWS